MCQQLFKIFSFQPERTALSGSEVRHSTCHKQIREKTDQAENEAILLIDPKVVSIGPTESWRHIKKNCSANI